MIRKTLLSAALQEYPDLRVVLLVDDPPNPRYAGPRRAARRRAGACRPRSSACSPSPLPRFDRRARRASRRSSTATGADRVERRRRARRRVRVRRAAGSAARRRLRRRPTTPTRFFVDQVLGALAADLDDRSAAALRAAADDGARRSTARPPAPALPPPGLDLPRRALQLPAQALRLALARAEQGDEPQQLHRADGRQLPRGRRPRRRPRAAAAPTREADLVVPDPDYVLTLDADSVLLPEYCLRLVHLLEQTEHAEGRRRPDAVQRLPRRGDADRADRRRDDRPPAHRPPGHDPLRRDVLGRRQRGPPQAGARRHRARSTTTATARSAATSRTARSSRTPSRRIDLGVHGWTLLNYPERLAYSATPPDFGSLCIQRQRWANGGLLILPKLWRQIARRGATAASGPRIGEMFLRVNYMASICWSSLAPAVPARLPVQRAS